MRSRALDLAAWLALGIATLVILWPLGSTNRVLAGVDAFTYFTPYWDYRMAAFRAGELPLWNPYIFTGVPFLANPQAAVLYPLHWPLSWLATGEALVWSAIIHCWLAAGFTYTWARRSHSLTRAAAFAAGLIFGLGGFTLARVENINQLNGLAWLPALLWLNDETVRAATTRARLRSFIGLAFVIALQLLAGHTQTTFINLAGWGIYAASQALLAYLAQGHSLPAGSSTLRQRVRPLLSFALPFAALLPALLLSAAQLLPTLELNGLGLRTGGLSFREAVSFSLRPRLLLQSLLPPFGGSLAEAFGSEGFAEFVGYVGLAGVVLAALGAWRAGRRAVAPLILAGAGLFLALGANNPFYHLLWRVVPGFDLFRAPARWLALFALGVAMLAGLGLDSLGRPAARPLRLPRRRATVIALALAGLAAAGLLAWQAWPPWMTLAGWVASSAAAIALVWSGDRPAFTRAARGGLIALLIGELFVAGRGLPYTAATAPMALDQRNATAALLAATACQPPAGRDRFLSLSDIRYDPGDLSELRDLQADRLPPEAVERLVRAAKQVEVLAPNLPMVYRLPALDGYDGGLLPLQRYVTLQRLFLPSGEVVPDGRLREQLRRTPPDRLLDLTGVRFVVTDKQRDLWAGDVYYDLEHSATLDPGEKLTLGLQVYPRFAADALGLVAEASGASAAAQVGEITVTDRGGKDTVLPLFAGQEVATEAGAPPSPAVLPLAEWAGGRNAGQVAVANTGQAPLTVRGISLINRNSGAHTSITISPRGDLRRIHSGDVKIYERGGGKRAWLVHGILPAEGEEVLNGLADESFDPRSAAIVEATLAERAPAPEGEGESVEVVEYAPERVVLRASVAEPALLVVADAWYPGWRATVDGQAAPVLRTNLMFRGVFLEPGEHTVELVFEPASWRRGLIVSLATLALLVLAALAAGVSGIRLT